MEKDVFGKVLSEELSKVKGTDDPVGAVSSAMQKAGLEFAKTMPVWMRCNFLLNQISKAPDAEVNWDKVNEILQVQNDTIDYNIFGRIESIEELLTLAGDANAAEVPEFNLPYFKKRCKSCSDDFELTRKEINFFLDKDLKIPSRCYCCRKGIKKTPPKAAPTIVEEAPAKTAMQEALEKAGLC